MEKGRWVEPVELAKAAHGVFDALADSRKVDIDYDRRADVLYVNFTHSPHENADYTLDTGDYVFRYRKGELIGVTVIDAALHGSLAFKDFPANYLKA